ncbi:MAG: helix-turn-helix domain-containing protein [Bauldia sp.]|nr:helix-turn-helix domain-containing protein [Bauldia sp.]
MHAVVSPREKRLAEQVEELQEENRQLRALLAPAVVLPSEWKLTVLETALFRQLLLRTLVTFECAVWAIQDANGDRTRYTVHILIHKIRRKLKPFGLSILCRPGQGYELADRSAWHARLARAAS